MNSPNGGAPQSSSAWLWLLLVPAVITGAVARFYQLGLAPFAVDEYYLSQSIGNVLHHGLPQFDCGGYYMRGLILQYLCAAMEWAGTPAELAPRLICATSSLLALPAAYLLARRAGNPATAAMVVVLLALSVWEIEIARFGRMYAPFQTLFLWYLLAFLRDTLDHDPKARRWMLILSIAAPFVWEGGIFLMVANLLPPLLLQPDGRIDRRQWPYLALCIALLGLTYVFLSYDFRGIHAQALPPDFDASHTQSLTDPLSRLRPPLLLLPQHAGWLALAGLVLLLALPALRWIWSLRTRPLLVLGLLLTLLSAITHQFLLMVAIPVLLLLLGMVDRDELLGRPGRAFRLTLLAWVLFWLSFGLLVVGWQSPAGGSRARELAMLGYQFLKFPDFVGSVVRPWAWAVPHLGAMLFTLCALAIYRTARGRGPLDANRVLMIVFVVLLLAASASPAPRQETRYVFFLYPVALIISLTLLLKVIERVIRRPGAAVAVVAALAFGGFALSEDFSPHHLRYITSDVEMFRKNMPDGVQSHLVIRDDYRALASWLTQHTGSDTVTINGVHGLDRYYPAFSDFFVQESSSNFPDWSCHEGAIERWGNYPLIYSVEGLRSAIRGRSRAYLVDFNYEQQSLMDSLASLNPRIVDSEGAIIVIELQPG